VLWLLRSSRRSVPSSRGNSVFDGSLYTSSTLALNVDTGKLAWHYQHIPGESLDLDEVFERVLVDIGDQKVVFSIGKAGVLWKIDRRTGKYIGHKETVFQNVFDRIDTSTGVPTYRADVIENQIDEWVQSCPSTEGGHNWQGHELAEPEAGTADHQWSSPGPDRQSCGCCPRPASARAVCRTAARCACRVGRRAGAAVVDIPCDSIFWSASADVWRAEMLAEPQCPVQP
jgi:hypothetical protein